MREPQRGNAGLQFARGGDGRAPAPAAPAPMLRPTPTLALGGLIALSCTVFLVQTRQDSAQNLPAPTQKKAVQTPSKRLQIALADRNAPADTATPKPRPALDFYTKGVRGSLFSAPLPPTPKAAPVANAPHVVVPPVKPVTLNPFADWSYTGSVTVGDTKLALLENRNTRQGQYVSAGGTFMGSKVKSVTGQLVTMELAGKPVLLAKSDTVNVTPLLASAGYLNPQPQQAMQMQQGGQAPNMQQMMMMQAMQAAMQANMVTLANGQQVPQGRYNRMQNRLNANFNGGPGGGGRGGMGGGGFGGGGFGGGGRRGRGGGG